MSVFMSHTKVGLPFGKLSLNLFSSQATVIYYFTRDEDAVLTQQTHSQVNTGKQQILLL
jgi:hypothetical protein